MTLEDLLNASRFGHFYASIVKYFQKDLIRQLDTFHLFQEKRTIYVELRNVMFIEASLKQVNTKHMSGTYGGYDPSLDPGIKRYREFIGNDAMQSIFVIPRIIS